MIGYKGFDQYLKCRGEQFEVGKEYKKETTPPLRMCSEDGYHYCDTLNDVFQFYSLHTTNRYCKVEILGDVSKDKTKAVTNHLRVVEEITSQVYDEKIKKNINLPVVREFLEKHPHLHVGGSTALFLYGIRLKRWINKEGDIDIVSPYFFLPEPDMEIKHIDGKKSGSDFDESFIWRGTKIDCRIDPKQRYKVIEYDGFKYKVSPLEVIMAAKIKYALAGNKKHQKDIYEICNAKII